ncbi:MAG: molybdenum cofactor guanylyltransferase [Planctomycetota bacterium]
MPDDVIAIVPAGGRSRRLAAAAPAGGKAALEVGGASLLDRVCRAVASEASQVIVVAAEGQPLPPLAAGVEVVRDTRPAAGPLAAIHDGLVHAQAAHPAARIAVIASCDLPALHPAVVRLLVERVRRPGVGWAVPLVGGHPQVLVSALATSLAGRLGRELAAGATSPRAVLAAIAASDPGAVLYVSEADLVAIDHSLASFADIDTPADLARLNAAGPAPIPPS